MFWNLDLDEEIKKINYIKPTNSVSCWLLHPVQRGGLWGCHCHCHLIFSWRWHGATQDGRRWTTNSQTNKAGRQWDSSPIQLPAACMNHTLLSSVLRFQSTPKLLTQILHILCCRAPRWLADVISGSGIISSARLWGDGCFHWRQWCKFKAEGWEFASSQLSPPNHSFQWFAGSLGEPPGGSDDPLWCSADDEVLPAQTPVSIQAVISSPHGITNKEIVGTASNQKTNHLWRCSANHIM